MPLPDNTIHTPVSPCQGDELGYPSLYDLRIGALYEKPSKPRLRDTCSHRGDSQAVCLYLGALVGSVKSTS